MLVLKGAYFFTKVKVNCPVTNYLCTEHGKSSLNTDDLRKHIASVAQSSLNRSFNCKERHLFHWPSL